jgi:pyruvate formate lyase activating enzyme
VEPDRAFYADSGGGVTVSGGEPLFQRDFARDILARCRARGIHTAMESNLAWPWPRVAGVLKNVDLVILDIKTLDSDLHRRWTGVGNERILDNAARLSRAGRPMVVRTPVIGGVNDTPGEIGSIADFIAGFASLLYYELLAYHPLGTGKYAGLGMDPPPPELKRPAPETLAALAGEARRRGLTVRAPEK